MALDRGVLVIAEVRTRSSVSFGGATTCVGAVKQRRIIRAAAHLLQQHRDYAALPVRFDVLIVTQPAFTTPQVGRPRHAREA